MVETGGKRILIDCGPDFREQMLRHGLRSSDDHIDAALLTHQHYDHVGGIDDLRPYCYKNRELYDFPIYCQKDVISDIRQRMPYSFSEHPYPGVPRFDLHEISAYTPFNMDGLEVLPLRVNHYLLEILGFRIGGLGYITDAKSIPDKTIASLRGVKTLVINALRQKPHISHLSLKDALDIIARIKPQSAFLTHISHDMGRHADVEPTLPPGVHLAFDGLKIKI